MFARGGVAAVAAVLVLAAGGCSDSGAGAGSGSRSDHHSEPVTSTEATTAESSAPALERPEEAKRALKAAVRTMIDDPATVFLSTMSLQDSVVSTTTGTVAATGWSAEVTFTPPDDDATLMRVRGNGRTVWMQMQAWPSPMSGCWLELGLTQSPVGVQALAGPQPAYLSVAGYLRALGYVEGTDVLAASVPIRYAAALLTAQTNQELDLSAVPEDARVDVTLEVGTRITSFELSGETYLQAVEDAGGSATEKARLGLNIMTIELHFPTPPDGAAPDEAPEPSLVVASEDELQAGC